MAAAVAAIKAGRLRKVVLARDLYATTATRSNRTDKAEPGGRTATPSARKHKKALARTSSPLPELLIQQTGREVSALVLAGTTAARR